jgi:cobalt-zinc-cadmium efflux system outer membrane protein
MKTDPFLGPRAGVRSPGATRRFAMLAIPLLTISWSTSHASGQGPPGPEYSLDQLLELGRERSPLILALRADLASVEADRRDSGRFTNPELHYELGSGDPFESPDSRSLTGWSVEQAFENPITRHLRLKARDFATETSADELRLGILDVDYQIRSHFYRILYLQELLSLNRLNEEALEAIRALIETRAELGEVRELEAIRLRVEHIRARNQVEATRMELDQFRKHLNTFLGNVLPDGYSLSGELAAQPFEPDLESVLLERLSDHPSLLRAANHRRQMEAEAKASGLGWLPDPVISGTSAQELDGDVTRFGIGLRIPLWNQSRAASNRDHRRAEAARHREEAVRLELEAQLMIHHNHLQLNRQTLRLFEEGLLAEAEASMEIAEISYRQGEISFVEYLDARRTYHSILIEHQEALFDWNLERAEFDRAVGGGTL